MRKLLLVFLISLLTLIQSQHASASHSAGGELLYEWVSDSTYKIIMKLYRDCSGVQVGDIMPVCYTNECDYLRGNLLLHLKNPVGVEVYPGCPDFPTKCKDPMSSYPGYEEYIYEGYVTLPTRCRKWTFFTNVVARNVGIGNLVNSIYYIPPNHPMYLEATLNNEVAQGNSSPSFSVRPVPYVCIFKPYTFNNGVVDIDGDLLRFEHIQPSWGLFNYPSIECIFARPINIPYCCGYDMPDNPFATNYTYRLDNTTGHISFTPQQIQTAVVTLRVKEYRNGVEIGSVMRDIQLNIIPCANAPDIITSIDTAGMAGSMIANNRVEGCEETPMEVCIDFRTPSDPSAKVVVTDNHGLSLPGASVTYSNLSTDSVRACFRWTPGANDTGLKVVVFLMKDSACRPPGTHLTSAYTFPVYVNPSTRAWGAGVLCPGDSIQLHVSGWPSFTWDVLPGGDAVSSLSCLTCTDPWARPGSTTRYIATAENRLCRKHTDTVTVTVLPAPDISTIPDTIICVNHPIRLGVDINTVPGENYTVSWSPAATLDNPALRDPVARPAGDITYRVQVTGRNAGCVSYDSVRVTVLPGFRLHNADTAICAGDAVQVRLTGDDRYSYVWRPAGDVSDSVIKEPVITPSSSARYTVTASFAGCRDSVASFSIEVQPVPVVSLPEDTLLCRGEVWQVVADVQPGNFGGYSYEWDPAGTLIAGSDGPDPLFNAQRTTNLSLRVSTSAGCTGIDEMLIEVAGVTTVSADTGICPGDTVQLFVSGNRVGQVWRPGVWISDSLSAEPFVYPLSTTTYVVYAEDIMNCLDTQAVTVHVYPAALISMPDSITIYEGEERYLDPRGNCLYFEWFPPEGLSDHRRANPRVDPAGNTRYFVTGETDRGCVTRDSIDVFVAEALLDLPNAFIPGSHYNGVLRPVYRGAVQLKAFKIFNRWGEKVFETTDIREGWDGRLRDKEQPQGVYVYFIEAISPGGKVLYKQGNITLLR